MRKKHRLWKQVVTSVLTAAMIFAVAEPAVPEMVVQAAETEAGETVELDLSKFDVQQTQNGVPVYDEATGTLTAQNVEQFIVELPRQVNTDESVKVSIEGVNNGTVGFRCWLSDTGNFSCLSEQVKSADKEVGSGEFVMDMNLTSTGAANQVLVKGPSYGTYLDDLVITKISVTYGAASGEPKEPKNPFAPEKEQEYNTENLVLTKSFRNQNKVSAETVNSMLVSQRFIADPTTIEYQGRLYVYGTTDEPEFDSDANLVKNAYNTHTLSCISTEDLVNWKDEGRIDVTELTNYAKKSWAPSIVSKEIGGKTKFFIYYTTGGDGIAVLTADSPTGPWTDPIGDRIINRSTPTCSEEEVPWLFDPGVFVDDDGSAYIYFGGNNSGKNAGRVCKLNDDMISLDLSTMHTLDPYYYFEDNEINKFGDTYYYSYSTNWSSDLANGKDEYTGQACIAYYSADNPYMENATYHGTVFANPGSLYGHIYNNHHHMFTFKGENYIAYHTTYLEKVFYNGVQQGYRNLHIDRLNVGADGTLSAEATYAGAGGTGRIDGLQKNSANIMSDNAGLTTVYSENCQDMVLAEIHTGDWTKVSGVDFGEKAEKITMGISTQTNEGSIEVYVDGKPGDEDARKVATVNLPAATGVDTYQEVKADLSETLSSVHDLYFVYRGSGYQVSSWKFDSGKSEVENTAAPTGTTAPTETVAPTAPSTPKSPATASPSSIPTVVATEAPNSGVSDGDVVTVSKMKYEITSATKNQVELKKPKDASAKQVTVPATVTIKNRTYKVTGIGTSAFAKNKKLIKVTIGKNVKTIGSKAFYQCSRLKKVKIKSTVLKKIGKNAFKGIQKKATFKVPKEKKKAIKKLLGKKVGVTAKMKIK